jgi:N-acetylglutamate synthase-like GNAT family acetyltransferase
LAAAETAWRKGGKEHMDGSILIRSYKKEDIDYIIERHRELYDKEYGFSSEFVDYVEKYVKEFDKNHDEARENIWIAEADGKRVGMIAIVKAGDETAQLRWFLIEPEMRGKGLGHRLMKTVIDFCKEKGYRHVFLWTADILAAARHLYQVYGFALTETVPNDTWTDDVINEERWDLHL